MRPALAFAIASVTRRAAAIPCLPQAPPQIGLDPLHAMIYRGTNGCEGCSESVQVLLGSAYPGIEVVFAGPDEDVKINAETLRHMDMFVQPGGPDLKEAWKEAKPYASDVRDFVARGGWYMGFCLGAYLAGPKNGFGLLPEGDRIMRAIVRPHSQVRDSQDAVIQVDWSFTTGQNRGTTERKRWLYFQDGAAFVLSDNSPTTVIARYSHNGDVAATLNAFGNGWVANVDDLADVENPDGIKSDIGVDFVRATLYAASKNTLGPRTIRSPALRELIVAGNL
ncbi:unnamed protein product [Aureobasidium uvarum]|uniref:Biotin-protein ligase N-terminal domain-containing protein n=1 Tax=Aureobasidium uvarum TaxID=2773716 RepID=A0A9N8KM40_9PEZI|nr:unnamed protein product [Aureobasidium uvarum]